MKKLPKSLLTISLTGFAIGFFVTFSGADLPPVWTVALPIGAVFLGLFLLALMLQSEMAGFDEEERVKMEWVKRHARPVSNPAQLHAEASNDSAGLRAGSPR